MKIRFLEKTRTVIRIAWYATYKEAVIDCAKLLAALPVLETPQLCENCGGARFPITEGVCQLCLDHENEVAELRAVLETTKDDCDHPHVLMQARQAKEGERPDNDNLGGWVWPPTCQVCGKELDNARTIEEIRDEALEKLASVPVLETPPHPNDDLIRRGDVVKFLNEVLWRWPDDERERLISNLPAPVEPVPAPRLEWVEGSKPNTKFTEWKPSVTWAPFRPERGRYLFDFFIRAELDSDTGEALGTFRVEIEDTEVTCSLHSLDAAKSLAEKLNALLSPPVGGN
jgi:hypothetical protein